MIKQLYKGAVFLLLTGLLSIVVINDVYAQPAQNSIQIENSKAGTSDWRLTNPGYASSVIEGYPSATSVNRGGQIKIYVNTKDPNYKLEIFRMGWYQGLRGRRMIDPVIIAGTAQLIPLTDPTTGLIECNWINPYVINIPNSSDPTDWMSGFYYVKLTALPSGAQQYVHFVVRDDTRASDFLMAEAITTAQAYNVWGGKSLYGTLANRSDTANAARKVSFDRPYYGDETWGAGNFGENNDFKYYEWEMVGFLEQNGYDVAYATNIDVDQNPNLLLTHKAFLSVGHDEYWSRNMRTNVEHARDLGINLGFFSANTSYWQVRFENSVALGDPARVMVGYKTYCTQDSITPDYLKTCLFRESRAEPINYSEDRMVGVMYITQSRQPFVVEDESSWVLSGTGLKNGDSLIRPGTPDPNNPTKLFFIGYEVDAVGSNSPANVQRIGHSPATSSHANYSDMVTYRASSGATVFATGSILWTYDVPQIVQITKNVLARLSTGAFADTTPIRPQLATPFQTRDIGPVGRAGFVSRAGIDSFTLNGDGQDSFSGQDALYYAYQPWTGDGQMTVRLTSLQSGWDTRAGIMIREDLTPSAKYVSIVSRPSESRMNGSSGVNEGVEFKVKTIAGGTPSKLVQQDLPLANWLKLVRVGNTFYSFISTDGINWMSLGTAIVPMNSNVYIGASVASAEHNVWKTAEFDHVLVNNDTTLPIVITPPPPSPLPSGWSNSDIGAVGPAGSSSYNSTTSTFTIRGAGADIWNSSDAFQYAYTTLSGDGKIIAHVTSVSTEAAWVKVGVMVRETLDPSSKQGFMLVSNTKGLAFQRRTTTGGISTSTSGGAFGAPRWVRLDRIGNTISAYQSGDGVSWTLVDTDAIPMASTIYVGLAVSSHTTAALGTGILDSVSVTTATPPPPDITDPTVSITAPANGASASGSLTINVTAADNVGVGSVQLMIDGVLLSGGDNTAPYSFILDTTKMSNGIHILQAVAKDAAGNSATSTAVNVIVSNPLPDTIKPIVSLTAPAAGAMLSGMVNLSATASDDSGNVSVQFQIDGVNLGGVQTASPFGTSWNTATVSNGNHTITVVATDPAGNFASSSATVTVSNSTSVCSSVTISRTLYYSGAPASKWPVTVSAPNSTCTWTATIDQPWITLNSVPGSVTYTGTGSGSITVRTTSNTTGVARFGSFTIGGATYQVTQEK